MPTQTRLAPYMTAQPEPDDGEVWRELVEGNLSALEILYDRYGGLALGLASRMLGDQHSAEDVVQESFLQAWRHAGSYDPGQGALRTWLLAIVHHRCIDVLRQRASRPRTVAWQADVHADAEPSDTWTEVERRLTRATIQRALGHLSPEQREAITLGYFSGFTHVQIAEHLGLPLGTVKGRLRLGLRRLHKLLVDGVDGTPTLATSHAGSEARIAV